MTDDAHHCAYCDVDFGGQPFVVITAKSSGNPTVVSREPQPGPDVRRQATRYLLEACGKLWGLECSPSVVSSPDLLRRLCDGEPITEGKITLRPGSKNDAPTSGHWHIHAERKEETDE